jgi:hypothetical protein
VRGGGYQKKNSAKLDESHFHEKHMALYTGNAQVESESSSSALLKIIYGYKKEQAIFVEAKLGIVGMLSNDLQLGMKLLKLPL